MTIDIDAIRQRPSYADMVAAIRTEFPPMALEALWIQMREHRYNTSSLGVLAQAVHDAHDPAYDVPDAIAELDRVRADLAAAHNHAHRTDAEIQRLTRDGIAYANENAELKAELKEAQAEGRRQAAADIERMDHDLGDDGWEWLKEKAENAGYDREAVRRRRTRLDFTTATIEMAYQYGYRQAAKVARGEVAP